MNTKKLKQLVLNLAIHGKLVPQDPNDEPASELLKRIQADVETHGRASNKSKGKKSAVSSVDLDEVPFEVPEGWCWTRIQYIVEVKSSKRVFESDYVNNGIPFYRSKEIGELYRGNEIETSLFITKEHFELLKEKYGVPQLGDILVTSVGSIGNTWICDGRDFYYKDGNVTQICQNHNVNTAYIEKFLHTSSFEEQLESLTGTAYIALTIEKLNQILIPLPPLAEQHRIVAAIEKWFAVIDQLEKNEADLKKSIEQTKKKVLDLAIRGKLVESEGEWEEKRLGDVAEYINGRAFKPEEWEISGMPIIRIQNLNDESAKYNYTSQRFEDKYIVNRGDLLFAWAASLGTYIWKGEDAWLNQHIFKVVPRDFISKRFLHIVLDALISDFYTQSHGSGMVHITRKSFENIKIPVPSLAEQKRIVEKIEEVMRVVERIENIVG